MKKSPSNWDAKSTGLLEHPLYSLVVVGFCLFVGLAVTLLAYWHFIMEDRELVQQKVLRGAQILAETAPVTPLDQNLVRSYETLDQLQRDLMNQPRISEEILASYLWDPGAPGMTLNIRYLPKTRYNPQTAQFQMLDLVGNWAALDSGITIRDAFPDAKSGQLPKADGSAEEYYPIIFNSSETDIGMSNIGLNHFADPLFHLVMDQARDSGAVASRTSFPRKDSDESYIITFSVQALYSAGTIPDTVTARRDRHVGFIEMVTFAQASSFIDLIPESYLGLDTAYITETDALQADNIDAGLKTILAAEEFFHESFEVQGLTTHIYARPSHLLTLDMQTNNRWWVLAIGLLITAWVCTLLLMNRSRNLKMQNLVAARTIDLAERSTRLAEVNQALTESESRYKMLADNINDLVMTRDLQGICNYVTPSLKTILGYDVDEFVGQNLHDFLDEESQKLVRELEAIALDTPPQTQVDTELNEGGYYEYRIRAKNGDYHTMEATVSLLWNENGELTGYLITSRDISERQRYQEERRALEHTVQQAQKMEAVGTLAGGIAHDFNNLLTGILGHAELIKMSSEIAASTEKSIDVIETAALRGRELTSQLLGFARKGRLQEKLVDINKMIEETILLMERTIDKKINITSVLTPDSPVISGDPGQISQVLINLAVNARDAMPEGGELEFSTSISALSETTPFPDLDLAPGKYCVISVKDSGKGIEKEKIERIFDPFYSEKEEGKGTGLGLAMVYGVTSNHGGVVTVGSEVGQGSEFKVYLPLSGELTKAEDPRVKAAKIQGSGSILVVDDEAIVRQLGQTMLSRAGYEVVTAHNGVAALDYYRSHWNQVDLVIMDVVMPEMGGLECLRKMKEINSGLKAIISTGYTPDSIDENLNEEYISGFLQKPFMLQDLAEKVARAMGVRH